MKATMTFGLLLGATMAAQAAKWVKNGTQWDLSASSYKVSVDPSKAGKIVAFQFRGTDAIRPGGDNGAFFWPAPQSRWVPNKNWPPPTSFNDAAYTATFEKDSSVLVLTGPVDAYTSLRVRKRMSLDSLAGQFSLVYTTINTASDSLRHFAPWEISRGFSGSLLFFPKASPFKFVNPDGSGLAPDLPLNREDTVAWYQDVAGKYSHNKFFRDGKEGWLAQLKDSLLFVKQYPDVDSSKFAPWESDIEIYTSGQFIENEVVGPWSTIAPGDSLAWNVRWSCQILPKSVSAQVGSAALVAAARSMAKEISSATHRVTTIRTGVGNRPLVDARGRLLETSPRVYKGGLGVLPTP